MVKGVQIKDGAGNQTVRTNANDIQLGLSIYLGEV